MCLLVSRRWKLIVSRQGFKVEVVVVFRKLPSFERSITLMLLLLLMWMPSNHRQGAIALLLLPSGHGRCRCRGGEPVWQRIVPNICASRSSRRKIDAIVRGDISDTTAAGPEGSADPHRF